MADNQSNSLTFEYSGGGGGDIMDLLKNGTPEAEMDVETRAITIYVSNDDTEEVKNAKDNIQFVVDSAREAVTFLMQMGKATGNARFFETVNSLLNTINSASGQLMSIDRKKKNAELPENPSAQNVTNIQNNTTQTIVMSTSEALKEAKKALTDQKTIELAKVVDVVAETK
ncbi:terminase small subunit [Rhizobium phage RHph_N34]|uniref:Terminase small subunit protein n=1 Tax=Rhizobium phage RHph_N34 TaxID=2509586 RepID=A0A7S5R9Z6_9CAUD|nr:terminase small subunit [Rhizobium phage RHph_N34]QIG73835.1 terminase small subunit protein [Rhizobium phage RHph_N34]